MLRLQVASRLPFLSFAGIEQKDAGRRCGFVRRACARRQCCTLSVDFCQNFSAKFCNPPAAFLSRSLLFRTSSNLAHIVYEYECPSGYGRHEDVAGFLCHDKNECGDEHNCNLDIPGAVCINTVGSFWCQFPPDPPTPAGMDPVIASAVYMDMPPENFTAPERQRFRDSVATASGSDPDDVTIDSVTPVSTSRRRRLLQETSSGGIIIAFSIRIRKDTGCGFWCTYNALSANLNTELLKVKLPPVEFMALPENEAVPSGFACPAGSYNAPTDCGISISCSEGCSSSSACGVAGGRGAQAISTSEGLLDGQSYATPQTCTWLIEIDRTSAACTGASLDVVFSSIGMESAAYKRYRFRMLHLRSKQQALGGLAEIRLYNGMGNRYKLCNRVSANSSEACILSVSNPGGHNPSGEGAAQAYDGDLSTHWFTRWVDSAPLVFEFNTSVTVASYEWITAMKSGDAVERSPVSWALEAYSTEDDEWKVLGRIEEYSVPLDGKALVGPFSAFGFSTYDGNAKLPLVTSNSTYVTVHSCASVEVVDATSPRRDCKVRRHIATLTGRLTEEEMSIVGQKVHSSNTGVMEIMFTSSHKNPEFAPPATGFEATVTAGDVCTACSRGTYMLPGTVDCLVCPAGTYSDTLGATACSACAAGTFSGWEVKHEQMPFALSWEQSRELAVRRGGRLLTLAEAQSYVAENTLHSIEAWVAVGHVDDTDLESSCISESNWAFYINILGAGDTRVYDRTCPPLFSVLDASGDGCISEAEFETASHHNISDGAHGACVGCLCSANTTIEHNKWCRHCASDTETRDLFQEISHAGTSEGSASHEGRNWVLIGRKPGYTTGTPLTLVCSQWPVYDGSCISVCDGASKPSPLETSPLGMGAPARSLIGTHAVQLYNWPLPSLEDLSRQNPIFCYLFPETQNAAQRTCPGPRGNRCVVLAHDVHGHWPPPSRAGRRGCLRRCPAAPRERC